MQVEQGNRLGLEAIGAVRSTAIAAPRFAEIDVIKAVGILTVVLIHAIRAPWDSQSSAIELWLGTVTRFAVPGLFFCSGFLYATTGARADERALIISVGHHPTEWLANWNADEVNRLLSREIGANFYLHGHLHPETINWEFTPEAMASVARILNEQELRIEELSKMLKKLSTMAGSLPGARR